jgi:alkaline phosphatase
MARKVIELLDAEAEHSSRGFFLQIEGASIDKQDHAANPCGQIGAHAEFDRAVAASLAYARTHRDTLVVVTADHGHPPDHRVPADRRAPQPGAIATLLTDEGAPMVVNYATVVWTPTVSQDHTGIEVRIAADGPFSDRVTGITNRTDPFTTFRLALGLR